MTASVNAPSISPDLLRILLEHAEAADRASEWPGESWEALAATGALRWAVPREWGGEELSPPALLRGYEQLAGACLTTMFLLSQRDAAIRRIRDFGSAEQQERLLPPLARGETFLTVGLSQLTTSRQHGAPALLASEEAEGYRLEGVIPWVTGAARADTLLIGASLADRRQLLFLVPRDRAGLEVKQQMDLCALEGSQTGEINCNGIAIGREEILAGPAEKVLSGSKGGGGLETSCLALGLASAAVASLKEQARTRGELSPAASCFEEAVGRAREEMYRLAGEATAEDAARLRVRATRLALQTTQTYLLTAKGTGFVRPHPAQRWARQALFFLVWSCPRPTGEGLLEEMVGEIEKAS